MTDLKVGDIVYLPVVIRLNGEFWHCRSRFANTFYVEKKIIRVLKTQFTTCDDARYCLDGRKVGSVNRFDIQIKFDEPQYVSSDSDLIAYKNKLKPLGLFGDEMSKINTVFENIDDLDLALKLAGKIHEVMIFSDEITK